MRPPEPESGTSLAPGPPVPPDPTARSAACDAVWRDHRNKFFLEEARKTTRVTIGIGILVQSAIVLIFAHADYPSWRVCALGGVYLALDQHQFTDSMTAGRGR